MKFFQRILLALALLSTSTLPALAGPAHTENIVLAGGCFWGVQAVFESLKGVTATEAGYAGGSAADANYEAVGTESTGHAESVSVTFDPARISLKQLLDVYFTVAHDPTELNRQGPDVGPSYRSEIFYTSDAQEHAAQAMIAHLESIHAFDAPIVTKLARLPAFYPAENYHQEFLVHNPGNPYIVANDIPKLIALRAKFPSLVNASSPTMRVINS